MIGIDDGSVYKSGKVGLRYLELVEETQNPQVKEYIAPHGQGS